MSHTKDFYLLLLEHALIEMRAAPIGLDRGRHLFAALRIAPMNEKLDAGCAEAARDHAADAVGRAGDERDLA